MPSTEELGGSYDQNGYGGQDRGRGRTPHRPSTMQSHLVAASGEFVGTFLFLYFGYAGNLMAVLKAPDAAPDGSMSSQTNIYIALSYGFALLTNVWTFYRISGGLFNPAVTLGLALGGQLSWFRVLFLFPAQLVASICAGGLVQAMFPGSISQANSVLGTKTSTAQGVFLEMFFTAQLVIVVLMLAAEKSRDTFLAPVGIGLALFTVMISGTFVTGASLNPVRSFGCAVAGTEFPGYHWIYWIGPALGASLAAGYYRLIKWSNYEEANPGQDSPVDLGTQSTRAPMAHAHMSQAPMNQTPVNQGAVGQASVNQTSMT